MSRPWRRGGRRAAHGPSELEKWPERPDRSYLDSVLADIGYENRYYDQVAIRSRRSGGHRRSSSLFGRTKRTLIEERITELERKDCCIGVDERAHRRARCL